MQPKKIAFLISILCIWMYSVQAQTPIWKWTKTSTGDNILQSENDSVGNTYIMGEFFGTDGIEINNVPYDGSTGGGEIKNLFMAKFDAAGKLVWARVFFGDAENSEITGIRFDVNSRGEVALLAESENNTIVHAGRFDLDYLAPTRNVFVTKISKSGFIIWARKIEIIEGTLNLTYGSDISLGENGKVAVTGTFFGDQINAGIHNAPGLGINDMMYVVKYNAMGDEEWLRSAEYTGAADSLYIRGSLICIDDEENIYVTGDYEGGGRFIFESDTSAVEVGKNIYLAKYLPDGTIQWARFYGGDLDDIPENLMLDNNDDIVFIGLFSSIEMNVQGILMPNSGNYYDQFITKISRNGVRIFAKQINSQINFLAESRRNTQLNIDGNNNILVATSFTTVTSLTGVNTVVNAEAGTSDLLFIKYEPFNGNILWSVGGNQMGNNNLGAVAVDKYGNLYTTSDLNNNITIESTDFIDPEGFGGFYIAKITPDGIVEFGDVKLSTATGWVGVEDIDVDVFGNIYLTGQYGGTGVSFGNTDLADPADGGQFFAKFSLTSQISGEVINPEGTAVSNGYVFLIGHTRFQRAPVTDSVPIGADGTFTFSDVPYGRYILSAIPYPEAEWLLTYYPEEDYWENAVKIIINSPQPVDDLSIIVFLKEPMTGENSLEGTITQIEEEDASKSGMQMNPVPVREASVVLVRNKLKSDYEVVATTYSDISGNFAFYDVDDGFYMLYIDVPGIVHTDYYEVWITGGQMMSNLDYYMDEETISKVYLTPVTENVATNTPVILSPNPAHDFIYLHNVQTNTNDVVFRIYDIYGRMVHEGEANISDQSFVLDINCLNIGEYIIKIIGNDGIIIKKFIKY